MGLLDSIRDPRDVRALDPEQLPELALEIRETVIRESGHAFTNAAILLKAKPVVAVTPSYQP